MKIRFVQRKNPQWLIYLARRVAMVAIKISEYRKMRRKGLRFMPSLWCAWNSR